MAKEDSYIDEAYEMLKHMSADEKKRLEYEAREKAIRDYNSQIQSAEEKGEKRGEQEKSRQYYNQYATKRKNTGRNCRCDGRMFGRCIKNSKQRIRVVQKIQCKSEEIVQMNFQKARESNFLMIQRFY